MTTVADIFAGFKETMLGLEKGLQVIHITTPTTQLLCCQHDEDVAAVFTRPDIMQFDQIPVKKGEAIIGLLTRRTYIPGTTGPASDHMRPFSEDILVSADTPLLEFLQIDPLDRLVIHGPKIYGLVTRSDLLKLPVSLLAFALVTNIEAQMLSIIQAIGIEKDVWINWVFPKNREDMLKRYQKLLQEGSDPDMLELTYFSDKHRILQKLYTSGKYTDQLPQKDSIDQLQELTLLRNMVAHGGNHSDDNDTLQEFIDRLRLAHTWLQAIEQGQKDRAQRSQPEEVVVRS